MRGTLFALCMALVLCAPAHAQKPDDADVLYLPTPPRVVEAMLDLAGLRSGDVLYDGNAGHCVSQGTPLLRRSIGVSLALDQDLP